MDNKVDSVEKMEVDPSPSPSSSCEPMSLGTSYQSSMSIDGRSTSPHPQSAQQTRDFNLGMSAHLTGEPNRQGAQTPPVSQQRTGGQQQADPQPVNQNIIWFIITCGACSAWMRNP